MYVIEHSLIVCKPKLWILLASYCSLANVEKKSKVELCVLFMVNFVTKIFPVRQFSVFFQPIFFNCLRVLRARDLILIKYTCT